MTPIRPRVPGGEPVPISQPPINQAAIAIFSFPQYAAAVLERLDALVKVFSSPPKKATRIVLALPLIIKKDGTVMANFELANDTVAWIPIHVVDASGDVVPAPSGDVFSAVSSDATMMTAVIGVMPSGPSAGAVALSLTPMVKAASALTVKVTDTSALTEADLTVDIVGDLTPKAINLDTVDVVTTPQAVPAT